MTKQVVRVAVNNNFNCTPAEWEQLEGFQTANPEKSFFVNSNINTPLLSTIANHEYKAVVTANPNLIVIPGVTDILSRLDKFRDKVAFVRIKYLPENQPINDLASSLMDEKYPIVFTPQRFNSLKMLQKYSDPKHYKHSCSRYRLAGEAKTELENITDVGQSLGLSVWICDRAGLGCQGCGLCSKLTTGEDHSIASLNLSKSGICPYDCPDCYAKTMQKFCVSMGNKPMIFDKVKRNTKQAGTTQHIKNSLKKAKE